MAAAARHPPPGTWAARWKSKVPSSILRSTVRITANPRKAERAPEWDRREPAAGEDGGAGEVAPEATGKSGMKRAAGQATAGAATAGAATAGAATVGAASAGAATVGAATERSAT